MNPKTRIAILGGGIGSLSAAYQLTRTPQLRAQYDVLHDKAVKDTMKKVVKKAVKEAVKEAVQDAQDAQDVKEAKSEPSS